ncbi:hypothetical protein M2165_000175 [Variovorax sp. TBS-050B]|uniref:hypothetical protein n=1 Tax=Variovorax sp. TBS-050B TaxID=2940551 RepID=UPI0024740C9A|nr:hypothetical protein [Variovorax sp. TBS-050B]MDH6590286.1 hypothetical protein [Variovorax sp. TBS-050B]
MKHLVRASALVITQLIVSHASAQTPAAGEAAERAQRRAEGVEAARSFTPGEGNPRPAARPRVSRAERAEARPARRARGAAAARSFQPGEGNPRPQATARLSREERRAGRRASRAQVAELNRSGQLPSYGDNAGGR